MTTAEAHAVELVAKLDGNGTWAALRTVKQRLAVRIELPPMTLAALHSLEAGMLLTSELPVREEVPLMMGGVRLSWCEFDVVGRHIAVRLTRLA